MLCQLSGQFVSSKWYFEIESNSFHYDCSMSHKIQECSVGFWSMINFYPKKTKDVYEMCGFLNSIVMINGVEVPAVFVLIRSFVLT